VCGCSLAAICCLRCAPADVPPATHTWFADVTRAARVDFVHDAGDLTDYWMPRINGSGVAVFDFDNDGRLDLYFLTFGGPHSRSVNRLFRNTGDGKFTDVTEGSGLDIPGYNTGVIVGDVDNDGWQDIVVTQYEGVRLFKNNGNGTFTDVTSDSGLRNPSWATSANLCDVDRDGWLDLVVVNYVAYDQTRRSDRADAQQDYPGPQHFQTTATRLFHNRGGKSRGLRGAERFEDVTVPSGLAAAPSAGMGLYCADFDGDGWQDIFIANDQKPNHLWINQRDGRFAEEALFRGIAVDGMGQPLSGMGVAVGDVDNDGLCDVYVTHLTAERNTLWLQGPAPGVFRDQTASKGLLASAWRATGWGVVMRDFDQDGWLDLAVVNGRVTRAPGNRTPALGEHFQEYGERNQIFRNEGAGSFRDISAVNPAFCGTPNVARGLATGDLDGDGAVDVVVTTIGRGAQIFRNVAPGRGHWLLVQVIDPRLHRDAYGARVKVQAGSKRLVRTVNPGDSFQSSSDPRAHFGLGSLREFDALDVLWPDGLTERFPGGATDRVLVVRRGEGQPRQAFEAP
jgi:hypothetical protein